MTTSLDDLLRYEEEPARRARRVEAGRMRWARLALYAVGISLVIWLVARLVRVGLPYPLVLALTLTVSLLREVLREVAPPARPPGYDGGVPDDQWQVNWSTSDGVALAASRWDTRLSWTQSDPERFAQVVQPALVELADERLRQRHGVSRAGDPARARALMPDPLWTFLTTPVTRSLTPQQLAAVIAQLEAL